MARKKKHCMEPVNGLNTRTADRDDCELYLECLGDASKKMAKCLPCVGCPKYKRAVEEKEYFQRRFENRW